MADVVQSRCANRDHLMRLTSLDYLRIMTQSILYSLAGTQRTLYSQALLTLRTRYIYEHAMVMIPLLLICLDSVGNL